MRQAYEPEEQEIKATKHKFMVQSMIVTDPDQLEHMDQIVGKHMSVCLVYSV